MDGRVRVCRALYDDQHGTGAHPVHRDCPFINFRDFDFVEGSLGYRWVNTKRFRLTADATDERGVLAALIAHSQFRDTYDGAGVQDWPRHGQWWLDRIAPGTYRAVDDATAADTIRSWVSLHGDVPEQSGSGPLARRGTATLVIANRTTRLAKVPRSRPLSRDRTRCLRCPASRGTTRCGHRQAVVARVPRRGRPVVRIRPQVRPGALHPRARCRPARQDAADS